MAAPPQEPLWHLCTSEGNIDCLMLTCCSGAELQVVRDGSIIVRELYPEKSDLYERARQLKADFGRAVAAGSEAAGRAPEASAHPPGVRAQIWRTGLD